METDTCLSPRSETPLPFTREEYASRLAAVRRSMADAAGVEVLLTTVPENIVYLSRAR